MQELSVFDTGYPRPVSSRSRVRYGIPNPTCRRGIMFRGAYSGLRANSSMAALPFVALTRIQKIA